MTKSGLTDICDTFSDNYNSNNINHTENDDENNYRRATNSGNTIDNDQIRAEPRRSARVLLSLIGQLPEEFIAKVSPEMGSAIKRRIKLPAVCMTMSAGLIAASSVVMMKCFYEVLQSGEASNHILFFSCLILMGFGFAALQTYILNLSMKYYNNTDVNPIYESFRMISWMLSGLILLDESKFYTWSELFQLGGSVLVIIAGIYVMTMKQS